MNRPWWQSPGTLSRGLVCLLAVGALAGCAPSSNPVEETGADLLRAFNPRRGVEEAYAHLHALVLNDPLLIADAAATLVADPDRRTRFAAVYVLSLSADGSDAEHLARLRVALDDRDVPIRAIAAGALVGLGTKAAIPVLIDLLTDESFLPDSVPQLRVGQLAFDARPAAVARRPAGGTSRAAAERSR